ncbi:VOC family protein [Paracoccus sp. TK19116]|uniref:VOC family protein n=1 Tax=Paracoccus albicereus TaxID=2922394 RepID=A0ABT1MTA7_9RHOB|nr:VOC family protein [Paracoccus albicereus]MCQ0971549.1 VOC family protein [Paracoccus albicereus]
MQFTPYLSFQGECREAFETYAVIFGGTVDLMAFSDMPDGAAMELPAEQAGWIMHAHLGLPDGASLMGADMPPQFGGEPMAGMSVAVTLPDRAEVGRVFEALSPDGHVRMEVGPTFFSSAFGMLTDRFGTNWMLMAQASA